jgi:hypothetical protein
MFELDVKKILMCNMFGLDSTSQVIMFEDSDVNKSQKGL